MDENKIDFGLINEIANILKDGGIVAIPTETVYGLSANALDEKAVQKIFSAKGRPSDNPLIVHISSIEEINKYARNIPKKAYTLLEKFSPGPLTIILKKRRIIPDITSAGLDTVALRVPNNKTTLELIKVLKFPLAAPSANISGSPSPTRFAHIYKDLMGKVDALVDGGDCEIGVESTVISLVGKTPKILRPGGITKEQIEGTIGKVKVEKGVFEKTSDDEKVSSPGMKYRHYAPNAKVIIVKGEKKAVIDYINAKCNENDAVMCFNKEEKMFINTKYAMTYGDNTEPKTLCFNLFDVLRKLDELNVNNIYARCPNKSGTGLAVYNRLVKASGFTVIELSNTIDN